jgi:hypothetical protein
LRDTEVRRMLGFRTTTPERALLDVLEAGSQPEQVALGLQQALERGLTTQARLRRASEGRSKTTRRQLERLLATQ